MFGKKISILKKFSFLENFFKSFLKMVYFDNDRL